MPRVERLPGVGDDPLRGPARSSPDGEHLGQHAQVVLARPAPLRPPPVMAPIAHLDRVAVLDRAPGRTGRSSPLSRQGPSWSRPASSWNSRRRQSNWETCIQLFAVDDGHLVVDLADGQAHFAVALAQLDQFQAEEIGQAEVHISLSVRGSALADEHVGYPGHLISRIGCHDRQKIRRLPMRPERARLARRNPTND